MTRREFLFRLGVVAGGLAVPWRVGCAAPPVRPLTRVAQRAGYYFKGVPIEWDIPIPVSDYVYFADPAYEPPEG